MHRMKARFIVDVEVTSPNTLEAAQRLKELEKAFRWAFSNTHVSLRQREAVSEYARLEAAGTHAILHEELVDDSR